VHKWNNKTTTNQRDLTGEEITHHHSSVHINSGADSCAVNVLLVKASNPAPIFAEFREFFSLVLVLESNVQNDLLLAFPEVKTTMFEKFLTFGLLGHRVVSQITSMADPLVKVDLVFGPVLEDGLVGALLRVDHLDLLLVQSFDGLFVLVVAREKLLFREDL